jgi:MFS family permease
MPDVIPEEYRSEANGVINTMGGIAAIVGTLGLSHLMDVSLTLPLIGNTARKLPFLISGFLVAGAALVLFFCVKENARTRKDGAQGTPPEQGESVLASLARVFREKETRAPSLLLALFFWFFGYQGILPFLTMYTRDVFGVPEGTAGLSPGMFAAAYALCAIPAGFVGHRAGRGKTLRAALLAMSFITLLLFIHGPCTGALGFSPQAGLFSFWFLLVLMGIFWVAVTTNSFPMLWKMARPENTGLYTGLYYTFSQTAAVLAPPVTGFLIDVSGFQAMYAFAGVCMLTAFFFMRKAGE